MQAAKKHGPIVNRAQAALVAGCDAILVCNDARSVDALIGKLNYDWNQYPILTKRLEAMRPNDRISQENLYQSSGWHRALARLEGLVERFA